ncbi:hypothetical protein MN116_000628 [Schistosoma mekongi]|uniref:Uncharacterized protein n=1 Tax=Schistosoma mekongi TaxID=38744 RepID=A0AAE1ZKI7_SCHME|nr:hypothetical protein MN116_000628 [Schistosoma mekongi]
MSELSQGSIEERYEMLKNLCKQQIVINETLKSEITKLNNIIRVVSHEKNLLLDELINNHSTCRNSVKNESKPFQKSVSVGNKRSVNFVESCQELKKVKSDPSVIDRIENAGLHNDSTSLLASNSVSVQEKEDQWATRDQMETSHSRIVSSHSSLVSTKPRLQYQIPPVQSKISIPVTPGGDNEVSARFLSASCGTTSKPNLSNPGSPPTITSNTHLATPLVVSSNNLPTTQRPNRGGSLVTNSSICPPNSTIPYVSFASQRTSAVGSQSKYVSVTTNRPLKVVSSGTMNNAASSNILKSVTSPPISPGIRLPSGGQPTNQRILIQPSSCNIRSVVFPRQQSHVNDSCEFGYAER